MNQKLQNILTLLEQNKNLTAEERESALKALEDADKELEITAFKLERTEKVKKTTAILLEETIEELEQKRKAVEEQNRELEIEASLERVRAVAMSMNKSDDLLRICEISFKEFKKLGFDNLRNSIIHILNDEKGFFLDYDYSDYLDGSINIINYNSHPVVEDYLRQIKRSTDAFAQVVIEGNELDGWKDFRRRGGQRDDPRLDEAQGLCYYLYSIGVGDIGISTFRPIDESQIKILQRFRNVFDLAYRRYNDIALAEEQAKEAQIELGLERVRARAMAMQKSDELSELVDTVFKELTKLDFALSWCIINIIDEDSLSNMVWAANPNIDKAPDSYHMKFEDYPFHDAMMKGYKERATKYIYVLEGIEKKVYDEYLFKETEFRKVPEEAQAASRAMEKYVCSFTFCNFGGLQTVGDEPLSDSNLDILERFGKVFDLTYTRFNDLLKAEAQAREAQIEAALERVRSRTMGMQKSEELKEVIRVVYEQFVHLKINVDHAGFVVDYTPRGDWHFWIADEQDIPSKITHPYFESVWANQFNEAKEKGADFFATNLNFEEKNKFYNELLSYVPGLPEASKDFYLSCPGLAGSTVLFENVGLYIENFSGIPYSDEENNTLMRFGKVFQQTYTRFNDLKQAEAQAREAKIEMALERVRSRAMAMQKSDELAETAYVLYEQFGLLGENPEQFTIGIIDETQKIWEFWLTLGGNQINHVFKAPIDEPIVLNKSYIAWKERKKSIVIDISGDELKAYYNFFKNLPGYKEFNDFKNNRIPEHRRVINLAFFSNGSLSLSSLEPKPAETIQLLERFAGVLEQTYTRFLDLQKAEAQAKEAQIEAALERVRAKAMAMHKSDDLTPAVATVFSELDRLGFRTVRCGIGIFNHLSKKVDVWTTSSDDKSGSVHLSGDEILEGHPLLDGIFEAWKLQEDYSYVLQGKELLDYYNIAANSNLPVSAPEGNSENNTQYYHCIMFPSGGLFAFRESEFSVDAKNLMRRFADVFQLTFTRHLDLRKAEAQAREAQIQLALERVRARTMAMHKSEELAETAAVLFQQMTELGVTPERLNICLIKEETKILEVWSTDQEGIKINHHFNASLDEPTTGKRVYDAWKQKKKSLVIDLSGQELNDWIRYVREVMGMTIKEELIKEHRIHSVAFFSHGMVLTTTAEPLPDESMNLLERFADVFNLTYTRFLDLKNAEAQTKEAKIEASLERVRSKAMAMHSPNDLSETVNVFFKELKTLGIIPIRCGVGQIDEATRTTSLTTTTSSQQGESFQVIGKVKQTGHAVLDGIFDNWKLQKEYHPVLQGEDIKAYYNVMNPQIGYPEYPEGVIQYGNSFPFKEGFVFAWTESKLSEEELQIFRRFTSVLSLTYRRYIDLKSAEVRAFDAIKQASLDRVRAEIASMRLTEDLNRITPIIWRELKTLEVPFFRCGVFIVDEGKAKVQVYLTTPDGKSLGVLNLSFDSNELTSKTVDYWRKKKVYKEHWNKEEFISWSKSMVELGQIQNTETYQGSANPPESLYLHFVPFAQGMLYVGDTSSLSEEKIELVKSLAESFSIAYSRYEDFDRLETAKKEVESAFGELDILSKELKIKNEELESENQRKALELEEARQLQLSMLPKELPKLSNLDIAVYMKTATEVGGDYYDFNVGADGTLTVAIGDATGHGMKAGTIVSMIKALFASGGSRMDMKSYFKESSDALKGIELGRLMMAFLMLRINSHKLQFANAGMPPLFIYRNRLKEVEEMMIHGMPLGAIKDFPYEISEIEISSGDTILLLSDGLPELKNERNQQYGYTQVKEKFKLAAEKSPDEIVEYLKNSAAEWVNRVEPDDDVTFVIIKIK